MSQDFMCKMRTRLGLKGKPEGGEIPSYLPVAHILGGALIGKNSQEGAVDINHDTGPTYTPPVIHFSPGVQK